MGAHRTCVGARAARPGRLQGGAGVPVVPGELVGVKRWRLFFTGGDYDAVPAPERVAELDVAVGPRAGEIDKRQLGVWSCSKISAFIQARS